MMSQTTLTLFFTSRKRPASDDISGSKSKVPHLDRKFIITKPGIDEDVKQTIQDIKEQKNKLVNYVADNNIKKDHLDKPIETTTFAKKTNITNVIKPSELTKHETTSVARKELSLGEIRKKLAGSSRLGEIKAAAERISKGIQQLKGTSEKKNLKEFKSIDLEVQSRYVTW